MPKKRNREEKVYQTKSPRGRERWRFEKPLTFPIKTSITSTGSVEAMESTEPIEPKTSVVLSTEPIAPIQECFEYPPKDAKELRFCKNLALEMGGECEVSTPDGRIDILTRNAVIEVKFARNWKHGIGQLLVYGTYYPGRQLILYLIGDDAKLYATAAKPHCDRMGITVVHE